MTTIYLLDSNGVFTEAAPLADPYAPLPRCTLTPPPETTGTEVAQWVGASWVVLPAYPQPPEPAPVIPSSITPRQARLALVMQPATDGTSAHLLDQAEAFLAALPEPDRTVAQISWEYATAIQRTDPLIAQVKSALAMTDDQVDAMFVEAAAL